MDRIVIIGAVGFLAAAMLIGPAAAPAVTLLLTLVVFWFLLRPFLYSAADTAPASGLSISLLEQKQRCVEVLKDLELDFTTRKIGEDDYLELKSELSSELSAIIREIDEHDER